MGEPSLKPFSNLATFIAILLLMLLATEAAFRAKNPLAASRTFTGSYQYVNCSDSSELPDKEVEALQDLADSFEGLEDISIDIDFCSHLESEKIACDCNTSGNGVNHIIRIDLSDTQLTGPIPDNWDDLTELNYLDLSNNELTGPMPESLGNLTKLSVLDFSDNQLTGPILKSLGNLKNLSMLDLSSNKLTGPIPESLGNLTNLSWLRLGQNFLNGGIPPSLGSISNLTYLNLAFNLLSDPIPAKLGSLSNLEYLRLEENQLSGPLPPELGQLINLEILYLSANNFTGPIPQNFDNLKNLTAFSVAGNSLNGKIPSYIGNWTNLEYLYLLGNEFEGPLPKEIFNLTNLYYLWVSDLRNPGFSLPDNANLSSIYNLIIRNSSVNGTIPECFWDWTSLSHLDLSYNKLTSGLSDTLKNKRISRLYLMRNNLDGQIPNWIDKTVTVAGDLSFNKFSNAEDVNVSSWIKIRPASRNSIIEKMDAICGKHKSKYDSFHINSGGDDIDIHGEHYESDNSTDDYFISNNKTGIWAYSFSGDFVSDISDRNDYVQNLKCAISVPESKIYESSRIAPVSLTYYGFCLRNGKYNVELQFAENVYAKYDDYSIQGKRIFDVYIQGDKQLSDFTTKTGLNDTSSKNIPLQAKVHNHLMEIHFYWAGKGSIFKTHALNGPLVSAISVTRQSERKLSNLQIGLIAVASFIVLLILLIIMWFWWRDRVLSVTTIDIGGREYSIRQIIKGTNNFSEQKWIYDSDYGKVYKAQLSDHVVAVNKIHHRSKEIIHEMAKEITTFTSFDHENLVKLYGKYIRGDLCLIIYEYLEPGPLHNVLFGSVSDLQLTWKEKCRICLGMAEGLNYLHDNDVIHTNIKDTNVLVAGTIRGENFRVKISDFWLAKLYKKDNPFFFEGPKEKYSSLAPEFVMLLKSLTPKVDVYGFGLVVLEILSGRKREESRDGEVVYLISRVYELEDRGRLEHDFIDDKPIGFNSRQAKTILSLAMRCIKPAPNVRPPMSEVAALLREIENT